jgi:hypothetical protein
MARMTTVAGMIGELTSRFANLEDGHAARTVYEVWRDICAQTEAWRKVLCADTTAQQEQFTLTVPATIGADILRVVSVEVNSASISTQKFIFTPPGTLTLLQYQASETATDGLEATVVLQPWVNDPTGIDADLFSLWHPTIYEGCLAKLSALMAKTAWYDPQLAKDADWRYSQYLAKIRMDIETGNTSQPLFTFSSVGFCDL